MWTAGSGYLWVDPTYFGDSPHFVWHSDTQEAVPAAYDETPHREMDWTAYWAPSLNGWLWVDDAEVETVPAEYELGAPTPAESWGVISRTGTVETTASDGTRWVDTWYEDGSGFSEYYGPDGELAYRYEWLPDGQYFWYDADGQVFDDSTSDSYWYEDGGYVWTPGYGYEWMSDSYFARADSYVWDPVTGQATLTPYEQTPHDWYDWTAYWVDALNGWLWVADADTATVPAEYGVPVFDPYYLGTGDEEWFDDQDNGGYVYAPGEGYQWVGASHFADADNYVWDPVAGQANLTPYDSTPHLEWDWTAYWVDALNGWLWVDDADTGTVPSEWGVPVFSRRGSAEKTARAATGGGRRVHGAPPHRKLLPVLTRSVGRAVRARLARSNHTAAPRRALPPRAVMDARLKLSRSQATVGGHGRKR